MGVRVGLGLCLVYLDRFEEAMVELSKVLKTNAKNTEAMFVRGLCFYYQDIIDKACEHFRIVLKLDPDHDGAKETLRKAKNIKNLNSKLYFNCATVHSKLGNLPQCIDDCTKALK